MRLFKAIAASVWLGWEREVGWTKPLVSLILTAISVIAGVITAAIVYWLGSKAAGAFSAERLAYVVVGSSLYFHVSSYVWVQSSAVSEGKWSNLLPYVYITPLSSAPYLAGRSLATFARSLPITAVVLTITYFVSFGLFGTAPKIIASPVSVAMLLGAMLVVLPAGLGLGYLLAAYALFVSRFEWALPSYVSGLLVLFSEALFPSSALPPPIPLVSEALPFTHFMRASRAALIYASWGGYVGAMAKAFMGSATLLAIGLTVFKLAEAKARTVGLIDKKVG